MATKIFGSLRQQAKPQFVKALEPTETPDWLLKLSRWCYYKSYFPQLGLRRDDVGRPTPEFKEALERLPQEEADARNFRIARAKLLSVRKEILPKEEWTKFEEDYSYVQPYLDDVLKEKDEESDFKQR